MSCESSILYASQCQHYSWLKSQPHLNCLYSTTHQRAARELCFAMTIFKPQSLLQTIRKEPPITPSPYELKPLHNHVHSFFVSLVSQFSIQQSAPTCDSYTTQSHTFSLNPLSRVKYWNYSSLALSVSALTNNKSYSCDVIKRHLKKSLHTFCSFYWLDHFRGSCGL